MIQLRHRRGNVLLIDDGLAFENRASALATDPHDDALIDASPAQITRCRAAKIVEHEPALPQLLSGPCLIALTALLPGYLPVTVRAEQFASCAAQQALCQVRPNDGPGPCSRLQLHALPEKKLANSAIDARARNW